MVCFLTQSVCSWHCYNSPIVCYPRTFRRTGPIKNLDIAEFIIENYIDGDWVEMSRPLYALIRTHCRQRVCSVEEKCMSILMPMYTDVKLHLASRCCITCVTSWEKSMKAFVYLNHYRRLKQCLTTNNEAAGWKTEAMSKRCTLKACSSSSSSNRLLTSSYWHWFEEKYRAQAEQNTPWVNI